MRIFKRIIIFLSLSSLLLILGLGLFSYFYGDEIKSTIVENINRNLKTKIEVKGIDFTVWNSFPRASIRFSDVVIFEVDSESDTLLSAKTMAVEFNLIELYQKNYRLIGLNISDGQCTLKVNHNEIANYIFWESSTGSSSSFSTDLENVLIENMNFSYQDQTKRLNIHFLIDRADLKGDFSQSLFNLNIRTTLKYSTIQLGEERLLNDRTLFVFANGAVNQEDNSIEFQDANLGIDGMNLSLQGNYHFETESRIDFQIQSKNTDLKKAIALLPVKLKKSLDRFKIKGKAAFSGTISGELSAISKPSYQFNFFIEDGTLKDTQSSVNFEKCFLDGTIKNGITNDMEGSVLELKNFSTTIREGTIDGKLRIENFKKPTYFYQGNLDIDLATANEFFKWENIDRLKGGLLASLSVSGKLGDFGKYSLSDWKSSDIKGEVKLSEVNLIEVENQLHFSGLNGNLAFTNNSISTSDLKGKINGNFLQMEGELTNLIGFLAQKNEVLIVEAAVYSPHFKLNNLKLTKSEENETKTVHYSLPSRLRFYMDLNFDVFEYEKFRLEDIRTRLIVSNKQIDLRNIKFQSEDGALEGDFFIREKDESHLQTSAKAKLKGVNIQSVFLKFNNFGQNTLRAEHLSGKVDANVQFYSEWSNSLEVDLNSIKLEASLLINEGELLNFKPVESLSKYIELEELKHIKFKTLENNILISKKTIYIPRFNVSSSAINLSLEGSHTFDQKIDYKFTVGLNEILGKKAKKPAESEFGYVEDEKNGGVNLFLKMTGTTDQPVIKYDTKALKNSIQKAFTREKTTTKSILKEEFGLFKKDSSIQPLPQKKPAKNPFQIEYDSSFIDQKVGENENEKADQKEKTKSKSKFGKFLDKITQPNEEEYLEKDKN